MWTGEVRTKKNFSDKSLKKLFFVLVCLIDLELLVPKTLSPYESIINTKTESLT